MWLAKVHMDINMWTCILNALFDAQNAPWALCRLYNNLTGEEKVQVCLSIIPNKLPPNTHS